MMKRAFLLAPLLVAGVAGCLVDNSGGPPPPGTELEFEPQALAGTCGTFRDEAFLVRDQASLDAFFTACPIPDDARPAWQDAVAGLAAGDVLVYVNVQQGGCLGEHGLVGAFLDGTTLHAWLLRSDLSYGSTPACTADIGEAAQSMLVHGAADATAADVVVGTFNQSLPGAPALPGG
jgi:hypothetical protein